MVARNRKAEKALWLAGSILLMLFWGTCVLQAQQDTTTLNLQFTDRSLEEVMDEIEAQTGLSFSYNSKLIDPGEPISLQVSGQSLSQVLRAIFHPRKLDFEVVSQGAPAL